MSGMKLVRRSCCDYVDAVVQWLLKLLLSPPPPPSAAVCVGVAAAAAAGIAGVGDCSTALTAPVATAGGGVITGWASFFRLAGVLRGVPLALPRLAPRDVEDVEEAGDMERSSLVRGLRPRLLFLECVLRFDASQSSS